MASRESTTGSVEHQRSLGLSVTRTGARSHVFGLAEAATRAGVRLEVFLTGEAVALATDPRFPSLVRAAHRLGLCEVSARQRGMAPGEVAGVSERDFVTQARNAELAETCDRYLVL